jgi:hypothetical protein
VIDIALGGGRMKKVFYYLLVMTMSLVVVHTSRAQSFPTDKRSQIVSGGFSFSSAGGDLYQSGDDRLTVIELSPSIGYFVIPGLAIGGKFVLERTSLGEGSLTSWGIGPHIVYFVGADKPRARIKGTIYPYLGAAFLYNRTTYKSGGWDSTASGTMISFGAGVLRMLSNAVGLFGEANYQIENVKPESGDSESGNTFNIAAGFTVFLY